MLIKWSLQFVPMGLINNIPALVQMMAWHRPGDKPLSEAMMVSLTTHMRQLASMSYNNDSEQSFFYSTMNIIHAFDFLYLFILWDAMVFANIFGDTHIHQ